MSHVAEAESLKQQVQARAEVMVRVKLRWRGALQIARREVREALFAWPVYVTATLALLLCVGLIYNILRFVSDSGLNVVSKPLYLPVSIIIAFSALFLAAWATMAIARPRDHGALRVLFFAPIDETSLVGGYLLAGVIIHISLMLLTVPILALLAWVANLPTPHAVYWVVLLSPALVLPAIAAGLFVSAVAPSGRSAALLFVAVLLVILAINLGHAALLSIPSTAKYYDALLFVRTILSAATDIISWLSPVSLISAAVSAALRDDWREVVRQIAIAIVGSVVWIVAAIYALRRRGVLP